MTWNITLNISNLTPYHLHIHVPVKNHGLHDVLPQGQWQWHSVDAPVFVRQLMDFHQRLELIAWLGRERGDQDMTTSIYLSQISGVRVDLGQHNPGLLPIALTTTIGDHHETQNSDNSARTWAWDTLQQGGDVSLVWRTA